MATIRTPDQRLRVFISSTMYELADERAVARRAVESLHLSPILFEMGARPHPPRELYRAYLEQSDIFVGIYAEQYGWIAPEATISGIEDEYNLSEGMPRLVYVRDPAPERDPKLRAMLDRIASSGISYRLYRRPSELQRLLADDLAVLLSERFSPVAGRSEQPIEERPRHDLPVAPTRFVGRQRELVELVELVQERDMKLLTLTGPGGIGKTRLALALAHACKDHFEHGAAAAFLAPVRSADLVTTSIATSLGLPVTGARSAVEVLRDYLSTRELLLFVDNFEHVVNAAPELTGLLGDCPRLRLLVTSREMLRVSAEHVYPVQPLPISQNGERGPAVELFLDRATAIRHDMPQNEAVLDAVEQICQRLDGLPLAIELAAARVRVLMPQEILARLHNRLDFLATGPTDFPERQRTLRRTIEWSYDLLTERERGLFRCLSVFRGGFTLEAAEGVITGVPDLLEGLASLLDKSLIRADASVSDPRFTMLETLREFALEQLESQSGLEGIRRRHAEYFAEWAAGIQTDGREAEAIRAVELDYDNLRAALNWLLENGDPGRVAGAATLLWKFWWVRSLYTEGIEWMERVKARPEALAPSDAATVEFVIGILAFGNGDYPRAAKALTIARGLYEQLGDVRGSALTWLCLGVTMRVAGDMGGEALLRRAVKTLSEAGDDWALAFALFGLGRVILMDGRAAEAAPLLEESVQRAITAGSQTLLAIALVNLAWARMALPDIEGAREAAVRSFEEARAMDNRDSTARAVEALAAISLTEGKAEDAAVLFGAAEAIRRSIGGVIWVPDRLMHVATETTLRDRLGDELYEARYRRGAELPVAEAVKKALECGVHPHGTAGAAVAARESLAG